MTASGTTNNTITRNANWIWALASENEWYKAAYNDPTLNGNAGGYWLYPTKSNTAPTAEGPPGTDMLNGSANCVTEVEGNKTNVGAYTGKPSTSFYGTYDQAGNLSEWNETITSASWRGLRGGLFQLDSDFSASSRRFGFYPAYENIDIGIRVVSIAPEPSTFALLGIGGFGLLAYALRRRKRAS